MLRLLSARALPLCRSAHSAMVSTTAFGTGRDGGDVQRIALQSPDKSLSAHVITQGAAIQDLRVKTASGDRSVIVGFDSIDGYNANINWHHGAVAGRFANRIANGQFTIDGTDYQTVTNEPTGHVCHSGSAALGYRNWSVDKTTDNSVTLSVETKDGDGGFPGTLVARVTYTLESPGTLVIDYEATTDKTTPVNLTNHAYFNLDGTSGETQRDILDHKLTIDADKYTPVNSTLIPTGELAPVEGTTFDFRASRPLRREDESTGKPFHYDHNFCLRETSGVHRAAELVSSNGDLTMETWTDQPGVQLFDAAPLSSKVPGLGGFPIGSRAGLCLETQIFPDSLHHPHFPQSVLKPGEKYTHRTEYRFKAQQ